MLANKPALHSFGAFHHTKYASMRVCHLMHFVLLNNTNLKMLGNRNLPTIKTCKNLTKVTFKLQMAKSRANKSFRGSYFT